MKNELREMSLASADDAKDDPNTDRQTLYTRNYGSLLETCLASGHLFTADAERLLKGLESHFDNSVPGETDEEFIDWASGILKPSVDRLCRFYDLKSKYTPIVHSAIWRSLGHTIEPNKLDDYPELVRELANEIWLYLFLNLDKFTDAGSAKPSTRIFGLAQRHTCNWKKKQQGRLAAMTRRVAAGQSIGAETLSEAEIAEMRASERGQVAA